jgi:hypothetical protein
MSAQAMKVRDLSRSLRAIPEGVRIVVELDHITVSDLLSALRFSGIYLDQEDEALVLRPRWKASPGAKSWTA